MSTSTAAIDLWRDIAWKAQSLPPVPGLGIVSISSQLGMYVPMPAQRADLKSLSYFIANRIGAEAACVGTIVSMPRATLTCHSSGAPAGGD